MIAMVLALHSQDISYYVSRNLIRVSSLYILTFITVVSKGLYLVTPSMV